MNCLTKPNSLKKKCLWQLKWVFMLNWIVWNRTVFCIKMDFSLNSLQRLICGRTQITNQKHYKEHSQVCWDRKMTDESLQYVKIAQWVPWIWHKTIWLRWRLWEWRMRSPSPLSLLPGPLWLGEAASDRVLSIGQIEQTNWVNKWS